MLDSWTFRVAIAVAIGGSAGYALSGRSSLGVIGFSAALFALLFWAVTGGDPSGERVRSIAGPSEPSWVPRWNAAQAVWYVVGLFGFLLALVVVAAIASTLR